MTCNISPPIWLYMLDIFFTGDEHTSDPRDKILQKNAENTMYGICAQNYLFNEEE